MNIFVLTFLGTDLSTPLAYIVAAMHACLTLYTSFMQVRRLYVVEYNAYIFV